MNKKTLISTVGLVMLLSLVLLPQAAGALTSNQLGLQYGTGTGLPDAQLQEVIANIINVALALLGIVAVVIILLGGFKWMTAGGNEEKVGEAKKLIAAGIVGLVIIILAYSIAKFVIDSLVTATS